MKSPIYNLQVGKKYYHKQFDNFAIMVTAIENGFCTVKRLRDPNLKVVPGIPVKSIIDNYYEKSE